MKLLVITNKDKVCTLEIMLCEFNYTGAPTSQGHYFNHIYVATCEEVIYGRW